MKIFVKTFLKLAKDILTDLGKGAAYAINH